MLSHAKDGKRQEEEGEGPELSWPGSLFWITLVTVFISLLSQWIVDAIEGGSRDMKIPLPFLATILLPVVGNAAEHVSCYRSLLIPSPLYHSHHSHSVAPQASAVIFAFRNRVELALGICVGSSTQVITSTTSTPTSTTLVLALTLTLGPLDPPLRWPCSSCPLLQSSHG